MLTLLSQDEKKIGKKHSDHRGSGICRGEPNAVIFYTKTSERLRILGNAFVTNRAFSNISNVNRVVTMIKLVPCH